MTRPTTGDKPKDIRDALVAEVAAIGSTAVSVNKIAARAGLSVGTIYRYHATKDDLLFTVFLEIKQDIHRTMMSAAAPHVDPAGRLKAMWFSLVEYGFRLPQHFQLVEMMSAEIRPEFQSNTDLKRMQSDVLAEIQAGVDGGVLLDVPVRTIETILASPSITLARRASLSGVRPSDEEVKQIFTLIWRGIACVQSV